MNNLSPIQPGTKFRFDYPPEFVTLPEYTAHAGQEVEVVRQLTTVRATDGWEGHADESELDPLPSDWPHVADRSY